MLFKRRTPPSWQETFRVWLWPRRSWLRSTQYVTKRILRLTATPYAIAAGVAAGVFTSFTPFMGLHFLVAALFAWLIRGNLIASALGTFFGNPLTFPIIWAATFNTGALILGMNAPTGAAMSIPSKMGDVLSAAFSMDWHASSEALRAIWDPLLYPMLVGGFILGPLFAIPIYFITFRGTRMFRQKRQNKLIRKATAIRDKAHEMAPSSHFTSGAAE